MPLIITRLAAHCIACNQAACSSSTVCIVPGPHPGRAMFRSGNCNKHSLKWRVRLVFVWKSIEMYFRYSILGGNHIKFVRNEYLVVKFGFDRVLDFVLQLYETRNQWAQLHTFACNVRRGRHACKKKGESFLSIKLELYPWILNKRSYFLNNLKMYVVLDIC